MKIAIITIQDANNYGAILQAFATKHYFSNYGKTQILNYHNPHLSGHLNLLRFELSVHGIKMLFHDIIRIKSRVQVIRKFRSFMKENLNLTNKLKSEILQKNDLDSYDVYVCGSDQIWNPNIVNKSGKIDSIYFLGFVSGAVKKLSFASSMGSYEFSDDKLMELKRLLSDFDFLSVRESKSAELLSKHLDYEVHHVFDPTLHLSKEEWKHVIDRKRNSLKPNSPYILVYTVPRAPLMSSAVSFYHDKLGLKVVLIDQSFKPAVEADVHIKNAGIEEFIDLYMDAQFVITDSFHGTCFSLIFEKEFVSISPGNRANRIVSLLTLIGYNDLLISNSDDLQKSRQDINYNKVNHILEEKREFCKMRIDEVIHAN